MALDGSDSWSPLNPTDPRTLLETNPYVIVLAFDFSKAFGSVRHATVLEKPISIFHTMSITGSSHSSNTTRTVPGLVVSLYRPVTARHI